MIFRLFRAGLLAGGAQIGVSLLATVCILFLEIHELVAFPAPPGVSETATPLGSAAPFLSWAYLLIAVGFVFTSDAFDATTTAHIRRASALLNPGKPARGARIFALLLTATSVGFSVFVFRHPPEFVVKFSDYLHAADIAPILWSNLMSVGIAGFGANAYAAIRATLKS